MSLIEIERQKYERAWADPAYRHACHGLSLWQARRELFPAGIKSMRVLDIGCGTGRFVAALADLGIDALGMDLAPNSVDSEILEAHGDRFRLGAAIRDMAEGVRPVEPYDFALCTDVLEHLPPSEVGPSLRAIASTCEEVLFKVAHSPNQLGGEVLHLTLEPASWWIERMEEVGGIAEYLGIVVRSGCKDSLIRWLPRLQTGEPLCGGQRCLIVGSAPDVVLPAATAHDVVVGANGGAAIARDAGRGVDVLATTSHLFRAGRSAAEQGTLDGLSGLRVRSLWVDTKNGPVSAIDPLREQIQISAERVCAVPPILRDCVMVRAIGFSRWVSTGVWAACLALASGATKASVVGVSGQSRDHGAQDTEVLAALEGGGVEVIR